MTGFNIPFHLPPFIHPHTNILLLPFFSQNESIKFQKCKNASRAPSILVGVYAQQVLDIILFMFIKFVIRLPIEWICYLTADMQALENRKRIIRNRIIRSCEMKSWNQSHKTHNQATKRHAAITIYYNGKKCVSTHSSLHMYTCMHVCISLGNFYATAIIIGFP